MLNPGETINQRYQLQSKLGRNAGRQTWLAKDLKSAEDNLVVVKLLAFGGDVQWADLKLFEREAQILQQLEHSLEMIFYRVFKIKFYKGAVIKYSIEGGGRYFPFYLIFFIPHQKFV